MLHSWPAGKAKLSWGEDSIIGLYDTLFLGDHARDRHRKHERVFVSSRV